MTTSQLLPITLAVLCMAAPSPTPAQVRPDTTILLDDRPTVIAVFSVTPDMASHAHLPAMRQSFAEEMERALPRLAERGFDTHVVYGAAIYDTASAPTADPFKLYRSTVRVRWRDREWSLPIEAFWTQYLWSPAGRAYICGGYPSAAVVVDNGHWYLEVLKGLSTFGLSRRCQPAP